MIQRRDPQFVLACLGATASILGCIAISVATMSHAQVQIPRFSASTSSMHAVHQSCGTDCSSVVISR